MLKKEIIIIIFNNSGARESFWYLLEEEFNCFSQAKWMHCFLFVCIFPVSVSARIFINVAVVIHGFLSLFFVLASCFRFLYSAQMSRLTIDESKNGSTVMVKQGETIVIQLPGNPTTGYTWTREGKPNMENSSCESLDVKGSYQQKNSGMMMTGAGGVFSFEVTPKQSGSHLLKLVYARPWMKDAAPEKTFSIQIDSTA